jgi:hypothetical protein
MTLHSRKGREIDDAQPDLAIAIVKCGDNAMVFVVEPKRWIANQTIG